MTFTSFLSKRLLDLLNDRRIVIWYDPENDFLEYVAAFNTPNCEVLSAVESVLEVRRRADEIYRLINESENPTDSNRCMLIYLPRRRGSSEEDRMRDPFEVYALAGAAFGDTEDQKLESLARQAMPQKAEEISRLFSEGRPDIALLDRLEKTQRWPLLNKMFHTESPADVIALSLCDISKARDVDSTPGCIQELLRLYESSVGFKNASKTRTWKSIRAKAAEYVLFSEFVLDMKDNPPESLSAVPRVERNGKTVINDACERMRSDSTLREAYIQSAQEVESSLRLAVIMGQDFDPGERDTFPFEERRLLTKAIKLAVADDIASVQTLVDGRKNSIWRLDPQRSPSWTALERASVLLESTATVSGELLDRKTLIELVKTYTSGGWAGLDRSQRLFEAALTACEEGEELSILIDLCRTRYRDTALAVQERVLNLVQEKGWPPEGAPRQTCFFDKYVTPVLERRQKIALFLVDSLRFEMGQDLGEALAQSGDVEIGFAATVVPTVTACGMAALMPGADGMFGLFEKDGSIVPAIGTRLLRTSADRMKLLSETYGDRFYETTLDELLGSAKKLSAKLKETELLVVRTQDPDAIAENLGAWRARRYLSDVIGDIAAAVRSVTSCGFSRALITADHGHLMLPEIPAGDVVQSPPGTWLESKRRCRLGKGLSGGQGTITLKADVVGIRGDVEEICLPIGFRVFSDGDGYFHGGLSLQEAIVPVVVFMAGGETPTTPGKPEIDIRYRSDRFTSRVIGLTVYLESDIFGTPAVVRIEAYDGTGAKAQLVGEAADCEARDEKTRDITIRPNRETPVPVLIDPDFDGLEVEIRIADPATHVVWARKKFKNSMLD